MNFLYNQTNVISANDLLALESSELNKSTKQQTLQDLLQSSAHVETAINIQELEDIDDDPFISNNPKDSSNINQEPSAADVCDDIIASFASPPEPEDFISIPITINNHNEIHQDDFQHLNSSAPIVDTSHIIPHKTQSRPSQIPDPQFLVNQMKERSKQSFDSLFDNLLQDVAYNTNQRTCNTGIQQSTASRPRTPQQALCSRLATPRHQQPSKLPSSAQKSLKNSQSSILQQSKSCQNNSRLSSQIAQKLPQTDIQQDQKFNEIYQRQLMLKQQSLARIQEHKLRTKIPEENWSFQPVINKFHQTNTTKKPSKTLQEYILEKNKNCTFKPQINQAKPKSPIYRSNVQLTPVKRIISTPTKQTPTFRPQTLKFSGSANYATYVSQNASTRLYNNSKIAVKQQADSIISNLSTAASPAQINSFVQRQSQFSRQKELKISEIQRNEKPNFTPKINANSSQLASQSRVRTPVRQTVQETYSYTPKLSPQTLKMINFRQKAPLEDQSQHIWHNKQIKLKEFELAKRRNEFKDEYIEPKMRVQKRFAGPVLTGDVNW